ncbi:PD-(D/E)XK nuclease family protein [Brachyspira intermedia]|uniref:PDDEXK-like family protein n=1 Tax=Brachyspira intermedia TaxID=84377 RepID=UPI0030066EB0
MNTEIIENTLLTLINEFKKDEEEKYNAVSNTIYSIHKSFLYEEELKTNRLNEIFSKIKIIIEEVKNEMKKFPPQFCIFDAVNLQRHENYNSNLLAEFLKINIENKATKLSFVKDFLIYLNDKFKWGYYGFKSIEELEEINHSYIKIKREEYAGSRRIDLFISYKKDFAIIIENKIYAGEQDNQLDDYYQNKKKDNYKNLYMIFLTPSGYEPYTLSEESKKELGNNFQTLKHSDIALWLEKILEKYKSLFDENDDESDNKYIEDYRLLKSAMIQTIHNDNMISNNTKELDMTKAKIQELLEKNLFEDIQTVEDVEEYKQIFNSVNELLENKKSEIKKNNIIKYIKPYLEFRKKILLYLKSNIELEYSIINENDIIDNINNNDGFSHYIEFLFKNGYVGLYLYNHTWNSFDLCVYIEIDENERIYKSIYNKLKSLENDNAYIYKFIKTEDKNEFFRYNINIEEDSPEEIAEVMIKLYNLLKENL